MTWAPVAGPLRATQRLVFPAVGYQPGFGPAEARQERIIARVRLPQHRGSNPNRPESPENSGRFKILQSHDLTRVDPIACLKHLNAEVSAKPHELKAVRPIVNFNMVDHRFVDKTDVLSDLDQRPNLAELTPQQFEGLITNLFDKMGLETRLTQSSRDGRSIVSRDVV